MKSFLSSVLLSSLLPLHAMAASGSYACEPATVTSSPTDTARAIAHALNDLKCDTTKPTNVASYGGEAPFVTVCCVQK